MFEYKTDGNWLGMCLWIHLSVWTNVKASGMSLDYKTWDGDYVCNHVCLRFGLCVILCNPQIGYVLRVLGPRFDSYLEHIQTK